MRPNRLSAWAILIFASSLLAPAVAQAGSWTTLSSYGGSNTMSVYVPTTPAASPGIVVSLHYCGGQMSNAQGWFTSFADKYGFLVIAGKSAGDCWDAGLGRSGERQNIVKAVDYVIQNYKADKTRVFSAGASSGACMTQALLASYPDVFAGGSSLAGVPAGAWTGGGAYGWSASGASTAQQWGDKVRQADPGFTGTRPRVQLWHGQGDTTLTYSQSYPAQVSQWTNVLGVTDGTKTSIKPTGAQDTWERTSYKDSAGTVVVEANSGPSSVPHDLTGRGLWTDVVRFFGLDQASNPGGTGGAGGGTGGVTGSGGVGGNRDGSADGAGGAKDAGSELGGNDVTGMGGVISSGGATGSGGSASGGSTSGKGGAMGTGGGSSSGGSGSGGGAGAGGTSTSGGASGSGGTSSSGGATGAGGSSAKGGSSGSGGSAGSGGASGAGGSFGTGGSSTGGGSDPGGCACAVGGTTGPGSGLFLFLLAAVGLVFRRPGETRPER